MFTFADLFAGVGGFHAALHAAGGEWLFASEIDPAAQRVYDYNWLRPLRQAARTDRERDRYRISGDIVPLTEPVVRVPRADVLAAGFPCQPFSKSGFQRGMDETRGTLFWNIARILQDEGTRPSVVLLENVRNLAGPNHRDTTFRTIVATLRELGYRTSSKPAVFSPHLLPPQMGGRPQIRERVFILAHYVGPNGDDGRNDAPIVSPKMGIDWDPQSWTLADDLPLQSDSEDGVAEYLLESSELKWIAVWDELLTRVARELDPGERLPGFPIWFDEFRTVEEAERLIGEAAHLGRPFPAWKANFLRKNAEWYERFSGILDDYRMVIESFPPSRRKFEWQAGAHVPLDETVMHFRPSGIRAKRPTYVPALVAITQTSILGRRRRITPREAARLQGLPDWFEFRQSTHGDATVADQPDPASYKQMGNGVNVGAAYFVFRQYVDRHRHEIPQHIVDAVDASPANPDERLRSAPPHLPRT